MIDWIGRVGPRAVTMGLCLTVALLAAPMVVSAQTESGSMEMRHFWHVFIAYAVAWILVFGWIVAIWRRLRRVEEQLN